MTRWRSLLAYNSTLDSLTRRETGGVINPACLPSFLNGRHLNGVFTLLKSTPSKLLKFKEWLTVPAAAKHLSVICEEEVSEADILRLALDGHLKLSVNFVNYTYARIGKVVPYKEARRRHFHSILNEKDVSDFFEKNMTDNLVEFKEKLSDCDQYQKLAIMSNYIDMPLEDIFHRSDEGRIEGIYIGNGRVLEFENEHVGSIPGVWDLPMIGGERLDVEHKWQQLTGGPAVTLQNLEGAFVEGSDGVMCRLQESFDQNEYEAGSLAQLDELKRIVASNNISKEKIEELLARHQEDRKKYLEKKNSRPHQEDYYPAGGLPRDSVLVVRTEALREFEQLILGNEIEKKTPTKPHGNTERNAQKREEILGAALSVLARWPDECKNGAGRIEATKIRVLIENKSYMFWREDGEPPLSTGEIEKLLRQWLKKTGE